MKVMPFGVELLPSQIQAAGPQGVVARRDHREVTARPPRSLGQEGVEVVGCAALHDRVGVYGRLFARGYGSAYLGYSESLHQTVRRSFFKRSLRRASRGGNRG